MLFHPMILMTVNLIGILIKTIILPLIYFSFIISIISNISNRVEFSKLSELGRQVITFIISGALTLFIGIINYLWSRNKNRWIDYKNSKICCR